jgi:hypothetical protein
MVQPGKRVHVRHKDSPPGPQELARLVDQFAVSVLGNRLGRDSAFLAFSDRVRGGEDAWGLAGIYIVKGTGRKVIARLLDYAAAPVDQPSVVDRLISLGSTDSFWAEAPLQKGAARRWLRNGIRARLQCGADLLTRRGAGKCLACGKKLSERQARTGYGRPARRDYCGDCLKEARKRYSGLTTERAQQAHYRRDKAAIKEVLDRALPLVLPDEPDRTALRRSKRS